MPIDGLGLHRLWYVGGRYAYASCHWQGFTDHVLAIIDMQDPTKPEVVGRFWLPGMNAAAGETPSWSGKRYALHHAIVAGNLAYAAWRDGGMTILDVADPTAPKLLAHRNWSPPFGGGTHTPLPLPGRNLAVFADEGNLDDCANGIQRCWVFDVRDPTNPVSISTPADPVGDRLLHQGRQVRPAQSAREPARLVADRGADLRAPTRMPGCGCSTSATRSQPREVAHFVPPAPERMVDPRPNRPRVIQSNDVYVAPDGLMYLTDVNAGLTILQYKG